MSGNLEDMKALTHVCSVISLVVLMAIVANAQAESTPIPKEEVEKIFSELPKGVSFSELLGIGLKKIDGLKIGQQSPNELTGLKFNSSSSLSTILPGISNRTDVIKAFGSDCDDDPCKLNSNLTWRVHVNYYAENSGRTLIRTDNKGQESFALIPRKEFIGRVSEIVLIPTRPVSVKPSELRNRFARNCLQPFGDGFLIEGEKPVKRKVEFLVRFFDQYGLEYTVNDGSTNENCFDKVKRQFARVSRITYSVPSDLESNEIFQKIPIR